MATIKAQQQQGSKLSLEEEVNAIFRTVHQKNIALKPKVFQRVKQIIKANIKQIIYEALKRAVRRQASLNTLELCDLLYAIERRGEKYKIKIGKTLVTANSFSEFGNQKFMMNYNDDEVDQLDDDNEK